MADEQEHPVERVARRATEAMFAKDWETLTDLIAVDVVRENHRMIGMPPVRGRDRFFAEIQQWVVPDEHEESVIALVASRGDRLALTRHRMISPGDYETEFLSVERLDAHGRIAQVVHFDPEDLDAAMAELDRRTAQLEN